MARTAYRTLVAAGFGALLGFIAWIAGVSHSNLHGDPYGLSLSLGTWLLGAGGVGATLVLVLDGLGLDLPLSPDYPPAQEQREQDEKLELRLGLLAAAVAIAGFGILFGLIVEIFSWGAGSDSLDLV